MKLTSEPPTSLKFFKNRNLWRWVPATCILTNLSVYCEVLKIVNLYPGLHPSTMFTEINEVFLTVSLLSILPYKLSTWFRKRVVNKIWCVISFFIHSFINYLRVLVLPGTAVNTKDKYFYSHYILYLIHNEPLPSNRNINKSK